MSINSNVYAMVGILVRDLTIPVIAERGISTPEERSRLFDLGIHTAVVGSAITRPYEITKRFIHSIRQGYSPLAGSQ